MRAARRHHDVGRARRRKAAAIDVGVVQEIHTVDDEALLARGLAAEHFRALHDAGVLLDHLVASAGRHVVTVGPDRRPRVVGKERPLERVTVVRPERILTGADRIAHRVRAIGRLRRRCLSRLRSRKRRWRTWTTRPPRPPGLSRLRGLAWPRSIPIEHRRPEDRHHDEPAPGELVVSDDGVAIRAGLAHAAEAGKNRVGAHGSVQCPAGRIVPRTLFREDRELRVDDLEDVVRADGERVVRWIPRSGRVVRARTGSHAGTEAVEAFEDRERGS